MHLIHYEIDINAKLIKLVILNLFYRKDVSCQSLRSQKTIGLPSNSVILVFILVAFSWQNLSVYALNPGYFWKNESATPFSWMNEFGFFIKSKINMPTQKSAAQILGPTSHWPLLQYGSRNVKNFGRISSRNFYLHSGIVLGSNPLPSTQLLAA